MDQVLPLELWETVISYGVHKELLFVSSFFNRLVQGRLIKDKVLLRREECWFKSNARPVGDDRYRWTLCLQTLNRRAGEAVLYKGTKLVWHRWYNGRWSFRGKPIYSREERLATIRSFFEDGSLCEEKREDAWVRYRRDGTLRWRRQSDENFARHYDRRGKLVPHWRPMPIGVKFIPHPSD